MVKSSIVAPTCWLLWLRVSLPRLVTTSSEIRAFLRQLLHAIETQLKAPKAPYRGISCLLLCLYDLGELVNEQYDDLNQSEASVWLAVDQ